MNGDRLIVRVRGYLRDIPDDIIKGQEWDDLPIINALNAAQDVYLNWCINSEQFFNLRPLFRSTVYSAVVPGTLPADYLHYRSAQVGAEDALAMAQLYVGGQADVYMYNGKQRAAFIIGTQIWFMEAGVASGGVLHYVKYPSYIGATSLGNAAGGADERVDFLYTDFPDYVYENIFAKQAMVLLSMKETYTRRDVKGKDRYSIEKSIYHFHDDNYTHSRDVEGVFYAEQQRRAQQAQTQGDGQRPRGAE